MKIRYYQTTLVLESETSSEEYQLQAIVQQMETAPPKFSVSSELRYRESVQLIIEFDQRA